MITLHEPWSLYEQREAAIRRKTTFWTAVCFTALGIIIGFAITAVWFATR